jgi:hypothetical protein
VWCQSPERISVAGFFLVQFTTNGNVVLNGSDKLVGPELTAVVTLWGLAVEYGPWFLVAVLLGWYQLSLSRGDLYLKREYDTLATKATKRETELVGEAAFWRERYLNESALSRTAVGALTTTPRSAR